MNQRRRFSKPIKKATLAEQVAEAIKESILNGDWEPGEVLPTEPELSEQFGVSRSVVRDATRMLAAQGVVDAQHGRGVFVTESQAEAFGDALLLALRRDGATVWDIEHFEQIIYPEIFAMAAKQATDEEIQSIERKAEEYIQTVKTVHENFWDEPSLPPREQQMLIDGYRGLMEGVFNATHNLVIRLLATPLLHLRNLRQWQDEVATADNTIQIEESFIRIAVSSIASRDPDQARNTIAQLMKLPPEAEAVMRQTPIGEVPSIPVSYPTSSTFDD